MILRTIPRKGKHPSYSGRVMIDTFRGILRVRKWPAKRGRPRSALQRWWVDWFVQANFLAKYADPMSQARAIQMSKGSGMYPRDVLLKAMRGRLYFWSTIDGWKWYSMAAVQDVSDSIDALAQAVGSVLVRAVDRWRAPDPGNLGDALTYQGPTTAPKWLPVGAAPGVAAGALVSWTVSPSILNGTWTPVPYDLEVYDTNGYHDNVVNPTRFTIQAGQANAVLTGFIGWKSNGNGERICEVRKNGVFIIGGGRVRDPNSDGPVGQNIKTPVLPCSPGDYFELYVFQSSGGALTFEGTGTLNSFSITTFA